MRLSNIDPARLALARRAAREMQQIYFQRLTSGSLRDTMVLFPTNAYAQEAEMSLEEYEEFVSHACFLNWDMVCDLRQDSEIRVDGELFCKDGAFAV